MPLRPLPFGVLVLLLVCAVGCAKRSEPAGAPGAPAAAPPPDKTAAAPGNVARRVIRKAELSLEVSSPRDAQARATGIVERHGGFVAEASAEPRAVGMPGPLSLVLRVPSSAFSTAIDQLRRLGTGESTERISSEDVTDEVIDLEARLANQRALERQFLQILERAGKVEEAIAVQRELAAVRTEIDRLEGRRRFVEREVSLSTIRLTLTPERPLLATSTGDVTRTSRAAVADALAVAAALLQGSLRIAGLLLPIALFVGLPSIVALRWLGRRRRPVEA